MAGNAALDHGGAGGARAKGIDGRFFAGTQSSQRVRLLVLMAAIMVVGVVMQSALIGNYLLRDFQRLEESQVRASLRLIQLWLDRFLQPMESLAREAAGWEELSRLQSTHEPEALRQRLRAAFQLDVGYDLAAVVAPNGDILFAEAYDSNTRAPRPLRAEESAQIETHARTLHGLHEAQLSGWTVVPGGLFAVAATRAALGDQNLAVIVGRSFDSVAMESLDDLSGTYARTLAAETGPAASAGRPMEACTRLSPLLNPQPQQLCVRLQNSILDRGRRSTDDLRLTSLAGFIVLMFATWLFIDRSLLRRLTGLTRRLDDTSAEGTERLEQAMLADGRHGDELGRMSEGLGRLLGRVRQADADLRERERSFRTLAESSEVGIFVLRGEILYSNPFASRLSGYSADELRSLPILDLLHEDWRERLERALAQGSVGAAEGLELRGRRPDGTLYWARVHVNRIEYEGSAALLATLIDVSAQRHLEQVLADEKENLQLILTSIHDGIVAVDHAGAVSFLNPAAQRLTGIPLALANGSRVEEVLFLTDPDNGRLLPAPLLETLSASGTVGTMCDVTTPQGQSHNVEVSVSARADGEPDARRGSVLVMRDVSDLRKLTQTLAQQASHDDLTGLINRREFSRRLHEALDRNRDTGKQYALCYLDLDQFKLLNDTCGHHAGDMMLHEVAVALGREIENLGTLARLGGDEFGVLLDDCSPTRAMDVANRLRGVISGVRFQWNGQNFGVDVSIGIAMLEHVEGGVDEALALADAACYMAKDLGRNRVHLYRTSDAGLQQQLKHMRWATRLKEAVEKSQFCLYAQSIAPLSAETPDLSACEALVRMRMPDGGIVTPEEFLAAAERYQMMTQIDRWVVSTAIDAMRRKSRQAPHARTLLFINLSGQSMGDDDFREFLLDKLRANADLAPQLVFEVTESAVISSLGRAKQLMEDVYDAGCAFALDDFGTGMSSFGYLKELRVSYLKIAGCFVKGVANPLDAAVCRSFTEFARMMNLTVIAEWIEDDYMMRALRDMGVHYGQGWHFSRPEPIEQVMGLKP